MEGAGGGGGAVCGVFGQDTKTISARTSPPPSRPLMTNAPSTYARQTFWLWWEEWGEEGVVQRGGNGHAWNEGTATSLQSVFFGYAKNSSGIWEARELLRKN